MSKVKNPKKLGKLYLITDTNIQNKYSHYEIAKLAVKGGADIVQLRDKNLTTAGLYETAKKIAKLCRNNGVIFLVNDRVDIALVSDADGVHLGKSDIPVKKARKLLGKNKIVGGTAHSLIEALMCQSEGADYIGYGHIFPTKTKFKPEKPKGLKNLENIVSRIRIPVFAIGGIAPENLDSVLRTGVHGAALAGSVLKANHPVKILKELRRKIYGS